MKAKSLTAVALLSAILVGTGCASKGAYESAAMTSTELVDTRSQILAARSAVDMAAVTFDDLVTNAKPDLKPQYAAFSKAVDDLNSRALSTADQAQDFRNKRDKYIKDWKADADTLTDAELKKRALERMAETQQSFDTMAVKVQDARDASQPFITTVNELRRYLGGDLTSAGIKSVTDQVPRVNAQRDELKKRLDTVVSEIDRVNSELKPAAPAQ